VTPPSGQQPVVAQVAQVAQVASSGARRLAAMASRSAIFALAASASSPLRRPPGGHASTVNAYDGAMHERIRSARTEGLEPEDLAEIKALLDTAFAGRWDEHDWQHCLGGDHLLWVEGGRLVGQAAVVPRILRTGGRSWRTGYVEAVAVSPNAQGRGVGRELMLAAHEVIAAGYELGGLCAGERAARLYTRLGWRRWAGPTLVDSPQGTVATPEEDGNVYVLPPAEIDLSLPIACDWRDGDVW